MKFPQTRTTLTQMTPTWLLNLFDYDLPSDIFQFSTSAWITPLYFYVKKNVHCL